MESIKEKKEFDLSESLSCNINGAENNNVTGCTINETQRCRVEPLEFLHFPNAETNSADAVSKQNIFPIEDMIISNEW